MNKLIQIEFLKTKRSFARYIYLTVPLILLLFTFLTVHRTGNPSGLYKNSIPTIQISFFNLWPLIISHLIIINGTYFNLQLDKKSRYRELCLSNNWSLVTNFIAKSIVLTLYYGISTVVFITISIYSVYVTTKQLPNISLIIETAVLIFLSQVCLIQLNLFLLKYLNVIIVFILNFILIIASIIYTVLGNLFWLIPHGYSLKIVTIMMGIHPNGVPLESSSIYYQQVGDLHALGITILSSCIVFLIAFVINIASLHYRK